MKSVNAIPIQLEHHPDYADDPQLLTRIGTTGTDGAFRDPYLDNSLHFTVRKAIDRIQDGSMRELSLAYRYTPDFTAGTTPDGKDYDFVMRDISANHVALVELGRAGRDVLVEDHQMEDIKMEDDKKLSGDDNPVVEETEVALADKIKDAAEQITDLHTEDGEGNVVDNPAEDDGDDKVAIAKAVLADLAAKGLTTTVKICPRTKPAKLRTKTRTSCRMHSSPAASTMLRPRKRRRLLPVCSTRRSRKRLKVPLRTVKKRLLLLHLLWARTLP